MAKIAIPVVSLASAALLGMTDCASDVVTVAPLLPEHHERLGHASGEACGVLLFYCLPVRRDDARFIASTLALLLAFAGASTPAAAISLNVDGNGLSTIEGDNKGTTSPQKVVAPGPDSVTMALQDIRSGNLATLPPSHTETTLIGSATASYGTLSGSVSLHAASDPGGHQAQTRANLVLSFDDTATVLSSTLAVGTPVTLSFSGEMASSVLLIGLPNYNHASVLFEGFIRDLTNGATTNFQLFNAATGTYPSSVMRTLDVGVGDELEFTGRLSLGGELQIVFDETTAALALMLCAGLAALTLRRRVLPV